MKEGGAERVILNLINCLSERKYDICLLLLEDKKGTYIKEIKHPVKVIELNKKTTYDLLRIFFGIRRIIKDYKPNIVISFLHLVNILTVIASSTLKKDFKLILSERNYPSKYLSLERFGLLKKWLIMLTYQKADLIISVSQSIKDVLSESLKISSEKISTIYNPLEIESIRNKGQETVTHPFFEKKGHIIISIGRLTQQKRFDRLLRAFSVLRKKIDTIYLIVLGEGTLRKDLEELACRLNVMDVVDFVGFQPNPYAWITKSDIFVLSSDFEGFPNALVEAMACGIPVISTDCPSGPNEIITNGKDGILVPVEDENLFADAMYNLLTNEDLRRKLYENAMKRVEDFRTEKIVKEYEELFNAQLQQ